MTTLFISDLHLCRARPDKLLLLQEFLQGPARAAEAVYILGDLFEAWAGDDDMTPPHEAVVRMLSDYTTGGGRLFFMRGNRDFLIGRRFLRETGATLLADPAIITLYGRKTLLMHGDTLCSKDLSYQIYRRIVNNPFSIALFLRVPFPLRQRIWHGVHEITVSSTLRKSPYIVDVYQPTVERVMKNHGVLDLIHGHTHKQAIHTFQLDGSPARRYVLGDWYDKDCVLVTGDTDWRMLSIEDYLGKYQAST